MPPITSPLPIYEALLRLATPAERDAILAGGPRKALDNNLVFGDEADHLAAQAAYKAMGRVISRVKQDPTLRFIGIDARVTPPRREPIEGEVVLTGRLMWQGPNGVESVLQLEWTHPTVRLIDVRVEPVVQPSVDVPPSMAPSARLSGSERIDDTERLRRMQRYIDEEGLPPKTAARRVAAEMPSPPTGEDSLVVRLARKFKERARE